MVRHVILWKIDDGLDKEKIKADAKKELEALSGVIDGILKMEVHTEALDSSSCDMMLDSAFDTKESLDAYRVDPRHVAVADKYVRPFAKIRLCLDFDDK